MREIEVASRVPRALRKLSFAHMEGGAIGVPFYRIAIVKNGGAVFSVSAKKTLPSRAARHALKIPRLIRPRLARWHHGNQLEPRRPSFKPGREPRAAAARSPVMACPPGPPLLSRRGGRRRIASRKPVPRPPLRFDPCIRTRLPNSGRNADLVKAVRTAGRPATGPEIRGDDHRNMTSLPSSAS